MPIYYLTKCVVNVGNLIIFFPTEKFDSSNEVLNYALDFFNNKKIYSTNGVGSHESYIKCVGDESKFIHCLTNII